MPISMVAVKDFGVKFAHNVQHGWINGKNVHAYGSTCYHYTNRSKTEQSSKKISCPVNFQHYSCQYHPSWSLSFATMVIIM